MGDVSHTVFHLTCPYVKIPLKHSMAVGPPLSEISQLSVFNILTAVLNIEFKCKTF